MGRGRRRLSPVHGVLVVDKPSGPTSHDVVSRARRALGTRVVGHAGTLDPMATGVLVVAVGEGTKLVPYLMADDKRYLTTLALGSETHTLDACGEVTGQALVPTMSLVDWQCLADGFVGEHPQQVPKVSAVRVDGERLHARARRGEDFEPPTRLVTGYAFEILCVGEASLEARVHSGKGFYVRSWARDLAHRAGTLAHLTALRRETSGRFSLADAVSQAAFEEAIEDEAARERLRAQVLPLAEACRRVLPVAEIDAEAAEDVRHGRTVPATRCHPEPTADAFVCLLSESGQALAIARRSDDHVQVVRGFREAEASS